MPENELIKHRIYRNLKMEDDAPAVLLQNENDWDVENEKDNNTFKTIFQLQAKDLKPVATMSIGLIDGLLKQMACGDLVLDIASCKQQCETRIYEPVELVPMMSSFEATDPATNDMVIMIKSSTDKASHPKAAAAAAPMPLEAIML
jgi:hypothetical protein